MGGERPLRGAVKAPRKPRGGFVLVSVTKLAMTWWAYRTGLIRARDLRVALACHVAVAARCRMPRGETPCFTHAELAQSCGAGERSIRSSLKHLERSGLLAWSESAIRFAESPDALASDDLAGFFAMLDGIPNRKRLVPVPRRMLRFLAGGATPTLIATVLGLLFRSLYYWPDDGCRAHGSCKASWIAETFGVSLRGVKAARKELVAIGWLIRRASPQWRMNRGGLSVEINLDWSPPRAAAGGSVSAPPRAAICTAAAPPESDKELSSGESENQEPAARGQAGDCISDGKAKTGDATPDLRDVVEQDLRDTARTLELHAQAVRAGLVGTSERERLLVVAAAEHAKSVATRNAPGLFVRIVRSKLWSFITQDDEDRANARLKAHLFGSRRDEVPRVTPIRSPQIPSLSADARIVQAVRSAATRTGYRGDPFYLLKRERPDWTRERWENGVRELSGKISPNQVKMGIMGQRLTTESIGRCLGGVFGEMC